MNFLLALDKESGETDNFTIRYDDDIKLDPKYSWQGALVQAQLWYSYNNISAELGNNTLTYNNGTTDRTITFEDGLYSVPELNEALHREMDVLGDYGGTGSSRTYDINLLPDPSTRKVYLELNEAGGSYTIDFSNGSTSDLYELLGFADGVTYSASTLAPNLADITRGINALRIHCDLFDSSYIREEGSSSDIIYQFVPEVPSGSAISIRPNQRIYLPIKIMKNSIRNIRVAIRDNLGRRVNLNSEPVSILLHIQGIEMPDIDTDYMV